MALLLKNAHVVDPAANLDGVLDVLIDGDRISAVGEGLDFDGAEVIDLTGKYPSPDSRRYACTFASPALRHKATSSPRRLLRPAGGFTGVCSMPSTQPVADAGTVITYIKLAPPKPAIAAFTLRAP